MAWQKKKKGRVVFFRKIRVLLYWSIGGRGVRFISTVGGICFVPRTQLQPCQRLSLGGGCIATHTGRSCDLHLSTVSATLVLPQQNFCSFPCLALQASAGVLSLIAHHLLPTGRLNLRSLVGILGAGGWWVAHSTSVVDHMFAPPPPPNPYVKS